MPVTCALTYDQLLTYTEGETARWREWFTARPDALDVPYGEGRLATIGELILHIFAVELRYTERLEGHETVTAYEDLDAHGVDELFAIGDRARARLRAYLATMSDEDARVVLTFQTLTAGTLTASKHKIASNVFLHAIRHWAQVAATLRAAGHRDQWGHDMLLSPLEM